jgi:hypothetical protein
MRERDKAKIMWTFVGAMWMGGILAGCGSDQGPIGAIASNGAVSPGASCEVFAPQTIRIHPLTHVDAVTDKSGARSVIVLHLELKDRYGDTVKWLGATHVTLSKPVVGMTPGLETQELRWDVPGMTQPDGNASHFDPTTRTYRISLEAPEGIARYLSEAPRGDGPAAYVKVKVVFTIRAEGRERLLTDEFVVRR